jgi:phage terminase large subunit GpA-like protein
MVEAKIREVEFIGAGGEIVRPLLGCIDSGGHFTDEVYRLSRKMGVHFLIPIKGSNDPAAPIIDYPRRKHRKSKTYLTHVGGNNAKDVVYQRLGMTTPGEGYSHFPLNPLVAGSVDYGEDYFKQLLAEKKELRLMAGRYIRVWGCKKGVRNEAIDCRVYAFAAARIIQQHKGFTLKPPAGYDARPVKLPPAAPAKKATRARKMSRAPRTRRG